MSDDGIQFKVQRTGRGKATATIQFPDGTSHTDKLDLADAGQRARFVAKAARGRKGITKVVKQELAAALEKEAATGTGNRVSQADKLVLLTLGMEFFHSPGADPAAYASFVSGGHRETWPVNSAGFKEFLAKLYYSEHEKAPSAAACADAVAVLSGRSKFAGPAYPVAVRVAEHERAIYLDLCDPDWRAVEVTAAGWQIVTDPPVRFIRRRGMLPLPLPERGSSVDGLRPLVNLPDDDAWRLFVAWLVAALRPGRPFPVLAVNGEQGSAKSTLCRMARALIDPNAAPLRRPPRDDRDLMIAANNGWIVAYDNLSGIAPALSDALCALATGGGFGTRELYTDDEEKLFDATRPILLNGIEDVATRADLLDRAICLTLPAIPDTARRDESALWADFERDRPRVLGALLDAAAAALRDLPSTRLTGLPRMADFALWVTAAEIALPWEPGAFLAAYTGNRGAANELALESSIIGRPILSLAGNGGAWEGTAGELLEALEAGHADEKTRKRKDWPAGPRRLSGELRRLAPNLRRAGVEVTFDRAPGGQRRRLIRLGNTGATPSRPSPTSGNVGEPPGQLRDGPSVGTAPNRPAETPVFSAVRDGRDGRDGVVQPDSGWEETEWTA
jgi:hypothetical protein